MLDFSNLIDHVGSLAEESARRGEVRRSQLEVALKCMTDQAAHPDDSFIRLESANQRWLKAKSFDRRSVWKDAVAPLPAAECYTALACDGSQIPLDRHEVATFYLLNVGKVALHYGCGSRPTLTSAANLVYREEDLLAPSGSTAAEPSSATPRDEPQTSGYLGEKELATRRFLLEMETLGEMIAECGSRREPVAFVDGTLILWTQESEQKPNRDRVLGRFLSVLEIARQVNVPIVGYLSRPASREVMGALRISLCADECLSSKECQLSGAPRCAAIDRLTDADLFASLLREGERTPLFHSESRILDSYAPQEQRIVFFYLNVGGEIARVELPRWCADNPQLLNRVHYIALNQAEKGFGYPVCLSEAHEQAVVRGPERDALLRLIEKQLIRSNLIVSRTAKAAAKRRRSV